MIPMERNGFFPEVASLIKAVTAARIEGKEHAKRRPATLLRMIVEADGLPIAVEIKPVVSSSPTGWTNTGEAMITPYDLANNKRGNRARIKPNGEVRIFSWFRSQHDEKNRLYTTAIWKALDLISEDPANVVMYQRGHCGICGRALTDEVSRRRGIGPECWNTWERVDARISQPSEDALRALQLEIKHARQMMQRFHPDKPEGDSEKFIQAREVFEGIKARYQELVA